ncbi:MAG: hypothetical protein ACRBBK_05955 [Paracoccaceae bacterium]
MSEMNLTKTRIMGGIWEGVLTVPADRELMPQIEVKHLEQPVLGYDLSEDGTAENTWHLRIAIPPDLLCDGVQTFVISDKETGDTLNSFAIVTGEPLEDDITAEIDLLRAELDMLKQAFRRHCLETAS